MSFVLEDHEEGTFLVKIPAMGRHNVANALAAYCAATRLGLNARRVIAGLADFEQTGMRQKVVHVRGVDVIEDCYNANPDSMKAALAMFREYPCKRRFALLGDMLELGDISRAAHEEVGRQAVENKVDYLVTYGEQAKRIAVVAAAKGLPTLHADTYAQAAETLLNKMQPGDACWSRQAAVWHWKSAGDLLQGVTSSYDSFRLDRRLNAGVLPHGGARESDGAAAAGVPGTLG